MNKNYSIIGLITVLATILIGYFSGVITEIAFIWILITEVLFFLITGFGGSMKSTFLKSSIATIMVLYALVSISFTLVVSCLIHQSDQTLLIGQIVIHALLMVFLLIVKNKADRLEMK
ncbi:hypothetical protein PT250_00800 [Erysipelothrix rhusiopathiae]|nr:hypothetical protein [Erysipelothrix rhusiopathiae]MDE8316014.1 hypothetical protein [Erysipelothrix rhusiopathiae]MDE8325795.1 hypothetical protein [Erysipelothrix rhusiopathiae]MDE8339332.1 hypothetical protein [Erysipelothrix rhusiopathiae]MDE8340652.1 hypothetical protein [Erysipelothrix rhusiopathiae]MDV7680712.1 hypothetical protein [Erysipelothrix rhusiopathiae]